MVDPGFTFGEIENNPKFFAFFFAPLACTTMVLDFLLSFDYPPAKFLI